MVVTMDCSRGRDPGGGVGLGLALAAELGLV